MKISFIQLVFSVVFVSLAYASHEGRAQEVMDRTITLHAERVGLQKVLRQLEKQAAVKFAYSPKNIQADRPVTLHVSAKTLSETLQTLLGPLGISYQMASGRILLLPQEESTPPRTTASAGEPKPALAIRGTVSDDKGEVLPGVSVLVKGSQAGTTTDGKGYYQLDVPDATATLVFSFVGYLSREVMVGSKTTLDVALSPDTRALEEVVVVGYGTQRKKELTSAVTSVNRAKLEGFNVSSFSEALTGQVAGVQISQVNGGPGAPLNVRIRGTGSITAGNNPLYVVDGFPLNVEGLSNLNTNDIESIEILKDASATAIYGSRGANGVVIVTTRRGTSGKPRIEFSTYTGIQQLSKKVDVLNPDEYVELAIEAVQNAWVDRGGSPSDPNSARPALYQIAPYFLAPEQWTRTDWQDEIYRTAPISDYNLSAAGGSDKIKYMVSAGYFDQRGILLNTGFKRYSARLNLDGALTDRVRFNVNFSPTYSVSDKVRGDGRWNEGAIGSALALPGIFPVRNPDGSYPSFLDFGYNSSAAYNPVSLLEQARGTDKNLRLITNAKVSVDLLKDKNLTYTFNTGVDYNALEDAFYTSVIFPGNLPGGEFGTSSNLNWVLENTLSYSREWFSDHRLDVLVGQSAQHAMGTDSRIRTNNYPNDLVRTLNAGQIVSGTTTESAWALASYFSRLTYAIKDKYYLNAAIRRDGSSRFGENRKWGLFPSLSAGWRLSEERFLKNVNQIDDLKIRASYGVTGNNFIANYGSIGLLSRASYVLGNAIVNAQVPSTFSNALLSWETSRQWDAGLDVRILKGRVELVYDLYSKVNSNLLLNVPVPSITGVTSSLRNIGRVRNQGMEWMVTTRNLVGKFGWTTAFNISYNRNKVLALGPEGDPIITTGMSTMEGTHITQVGQPIGSFYGFVFEGIYNTADEIAARPHLTTDKPGDPIIRDVSGDGMISMDDRTLIGNHFPDYTFGLDNIFRFKNFDLRVFLHGVQGIEILNLTKHGVGIVHGRLNQLGEARDRWRSAEEPGNGQVFRANLDINGYRRLASTHYLEDASFVRLKNITLGYSFHPSLLTRLKIAQAKVVLTGQNLFTFTQYSMYNPEASQNRYNTSLSPGSDMDVYPLARTYTLGLNLTF
ncbi:TonB-dependent receptor [Rhabdobacter roseus]|uniref:TonB-linked SusC/RagA family outer membrane protein n=1 Tax=Rhabdobacter roseus TaxID=1655419 RepID=A0A840TI00_9BACT|nr:TonB-dependent receptor [Rhabdobacter roseus]MBB5282921.1 TonB-linked SusC/RagA family outer membrane protein [Rhabdobacter roseus]